MNVKNTVKRAPASGSSSPNANRAALQIIKFCLEGECANLALDAHAFPAGLNRMQHRQQRSYFAVYFGHQTKRWNPKMKEYIFGERNGIYIVDLQKTLKLFKDAMRYVAEAAA